MQPTKVGIREFRENLSSYLESRTPVAITRHGATIGIYVPTKPKPSQADLEALRVAGEKMQELENVHNQTGECLARHDRVEKPPRTSGDSPGLPAFFMKFRGPQAHPNRPRKTMVCPTFSKKCTGPTRMEKTPDDPEGPGYRVPANSCHNAR
jgi:antitoxin (DNA-binding transcriptional repressor) of toxin-antitoxin stability system